MGNYKHTDLLYLVRDKFVKYFDIQDVDDHLIDGDILTRDEYNDIIPNQYQGIIADKCEECIDKIFFHLIYKRKDIVKFFELIKAEYHHITTSWDEKIRQDPNTLIDEYYEFLRYSEIPKNRDNLVHRLDYLWPVQQHLKILEPGNYLILTGKPNHGKKWIACDAVTNLPIAKQMNFKIYWLNLHKCDKLEIVLEKMIKLKIIIGGSSCLDGPYSANCNVKNKIYFLKKELQKIFQQEKYQSSLLVLTGVQNEEVLKSFEFYCKTLVTTRFPSAYQFISKHRRHVIPINNGFTNLEAEEYFGKFLNKDRPDDSLTDVEIKYIHKINNLCHGIPLILNIIARRLTQFRFNTPIQEENWKEWIRVLRSNEYAFNEVADIERSYEKLSKSAIEYFEQFVIFRYNINVPLSLLTKYWKTGSDMKTEEILITLKDSALIEIEHIDSKTFCHINYVNYNYLISKYRNTKELIKLHKKVVNVYQVSEVLENRKKYYLPEFVDDKYFYEHIGYHLNECRMHELLIKLFTDFGFIERKMRSTNLLNTITDLKLLDRLLIEWNFTKHFFGELIDYFLPAVEEQILTSDETCLLQLALSWRHGVVKEEAMRQAELLDNHLWFEDIYQSKFYEIVTLPQNVTVAHFYKTNIVLFALADMTIILKDFNSTHYTIFKGHRAKIIDILTLDYEYFLSLDELGTVKLWCIKHSQVLHNGTKSENDEVDNNLNDFHRFHIKEDVKYSLQEINGMDSERIITMKPLPNKIVQFVTAVNGKNTCYLHSYLYKADTNNYSKILIYNETAEIKQIDIDAKFNVCWNNEYYLFINEFGQIFGQNIQNNSGIEVIMTVTSINRGKLINVHQKQQNSFLFVYEKSVENYEFSIEDDNRVNIINIQVETVLAFEDNTINFSLMSIDPKNFGKYIFLATQRGCCMYNFEEQEIYETKNKENILMLNAACMSNDQDDYLVIFCTKKCPNIIYKWYPLYNKLNRKKIKSSAVIKSEQFVYDVNYNVALDEFSVYSVVEESKIKKIVCSNHDSSTTKEIYDPQEVSSKINKISTCATCTVFTCEDNSLYFTDITRQKLIFLKRVPSPITYLKCFDANTILISICEKTDRNYLIVNVNVWLNLDDLSYGAVQDAQQLYENYILIKSNANVYSILDISTTQIISSITFDCAIEISNLIANTMFIYRGATCFYACDLSKDKIEQEEIVPRTLYFTGLKLGKVTCFDVTDDKTTLAVAYDTGAISVFRMGSNDPNLLELIVLDRSSFGSTITDLNFFPTDKPLLIIVLNDRIYFYNCEVASEDFKLKTMQRRNARAIGFDSKRRLCFNTGEPKHNGGAGDGKRLVYNKIGHHDLNNSDKLILSCYKLEGNSPYKLFCNKKFMNFLTIDNAANMHYLTLLDFKKGKSNEINQF